MMSRGGKNLLLLGLGSLVITLVTTTVTLALYHSSGDIYLDRSRPGFLPDEEEESTSDRQSSKYTFPDDGSLDEAAFSEYLEEIKPSTDELDLLSDPFSPDPLSDESLGIPEAKDEESV